MNVFGRLWVRLTAPRATDQDEAQREHMTRVILLIQAITLSVFTIPIVAGWIANAFPLESVLIMVLMLAPALAGLWLMNHGFLNLARWMPSLVTFAAALVLNLLVPLGITPLLLYVLAIMLAAILQGLRAQWFMVGLSLVAYLAIGASQLQLTFQDLGEVAISLAGALTGIALLQWFSIDQSQRSLSKVRDHAGKLEEYQRELAAANEELQAEVVERVRAEEELKEYSERLEEMVEERTKELREAQEQLVRREKLAVLGQLAGGVGHELRNPLGAIKNAAYFLNMVLKDPDVETREMLEVLDKEAGTAEKIISSLLDLARTGPPARRTVDLNDVVREALSRTPLPAAKRPEDRRGNTPRVEVVLQLDEDLPPILADPDQLSQVFGNIIRNGVQAMPDGGRLVIKSECDGDHMGRPEWVAVSIADSGQGISEENLKKIFEPLFTTKAKGIGLGLAVSRSRVEGHGGTIAVESQIGEGSTFTVRLPLGASAAVEEERT